ncbi:uncharacterized protein VTP21DRAFT_2528 [Calcarisporiella thermophila]|uniref:uncharacterized protein n=1 Tax=Calcarisporiella thermophila TaxID=911321 RepID=UPI00374262CC
MTRTLMTRPRYEIHYFPIHARADLPRLMLEYRQADYINVFVDDYRGPNATRKWLDDEKIKTPLGHLPVLVEKGADGKEFKLSETGAINRYLACQLGLMGNTSDAREVAYVDMINESWQEFSPAYGQMHRNPRHPGPGDNADHFFNAFVPERLYYLNRLLGDKSRFLDGGRTSIADLNALIWVHNIGEVCGRHDIFEKHAPNVLKLYESLMGEPHLREYYKPGGKREGIYKYPE